MIRCKFNNRVYSVVFNGEEGFILYSFATKKSFVLSIYMTTKDVSNYLAREDV